MRNTDKFKTIYRRIIPAFPVLAVLVAVSCILAFTEGFDTSLGYFDRGIWVTVLTVLAVLSVASSACIAFLSKKTELSYRDDTTPFSLFSRLLSAASALIVFIKFVLSFISHEQLSVFSIVSNCLMLFTAVAFVLSVFDPMKKKSVTTACWLLAAISVNLDIFIRYFDFSTAVNGDLRHLFTVAECGALLLIISEARLTFDKKYELATSPFFVFINCAAASCALGISIGLIYFGFTEKGSLPFPWLALFVATSLTALDRMFNAYTVKK